MKIKYYKLNNMYICWRLITWRASKNFESYFVIFPKNDLWGGPKMARLGFSYYIHIIKSAVKDAVPS